MTRQEHLSKVDLLSGAPARSYTALSEARMFVAIRLVEVKEEHHRLQSLLLQLEAVKSRPGAVREIDTGTMMLALSLLNIASRRRSDSEEVLDVVAGNPGLRAAEIARESGVRPSLVYKILKRLDEGGSLQKRGYKYYPAAESPCEPREGLQ